MKITRSTSTISGLIDAIEDGSIEMQPDYQRGYVWNRDKKQKLIDTILRDWTIPPIHMIELAVNHYEVLDGQQRLRSIEDFVKDKFPIDGEIKPYDKKVHAYHGLYFSHLPHEVKNEILSFKLENYILSDYHPGEPGELFYRLNSLMTLTPGEKRNSLFGPPRNQLKDLVIEFSKLDNNADTIGFNNYRMQYDDVIAKFLIHLERGRIDFKASERLISERFRDGEPFDGSVIDRAVNSFNQFSKSRDVAVRVKLNKATLLSWLLFYSRYLETSAPSSFLADFESLRLGPSMFHSEPSHQELFWIEIYNNRASFRVTDVSSVIFRDISLWSVFLLGDYGRPPRQLDRDLLGRLRDSIYTWTDGNTERLLDSKIEVESWGRI